MPDFSELASYLRAQIDLDSDQLYSDEPWTWAPPSAQPAVQPAATFTAPKPAPSFKPGFAPSAPRPAPAPAPKPRPAFTPAAKIVIPESAKSAIPSAYETADSLEKFYELVAAEKLYAKTPFIRGEGNLNKPRLLLVVYSPLPKYLENGYAKSDVGEMVARMFGSLNVKPEDIGVTYFCKKQVSRMVLPQVALVFKKMLEKEVSLIQPQTVIFFGDKLLKQALSQNNVKVVDFGGKPLEFAKTQATAMIDPEEMLTNRQLKLVTWKIQIPKCGFFG
ncbi:MAG: hypothetical protein K6A31_09100 [Fibrobacter sp.]|nr:hypothetical protein [Fibrobacter sp.]